MKNPPAHTVVFTKFQNANGPLTKTYTLRDGQLQKQTAGQMYEGRAVQLEAADAVEFGAILAKLQHHEALCYGVAEQKNVQIVTAELVPKTPGAVARTKEHFKFRAAPGILFLDGDAAYFAEPIDTPDQFWIALVEMMPELAAASMVITASASSHIHGPDGACLVGPRGYHACVLVADASDIPRVGAALYEKLWARGSGQYSVAKNGALLDRNLIDKSVWQPQFLDFAAGARCAPPLSQRRPAPAVFGAGLALFDTRRIADPTIEEKEAAAKHRAIAKALVEPQRQQARAEYTEVAVAELIQRAKIPEDRARAVVKAMLDDRPLLFAEVLLYPENDKPFTVGQALDDPGKFHGRQVADPLEPDYRSDRRIARLNLRSGGRPYIWSYAHGGQRYELIRQPATLQLAAGQEPRVADEALAIMRTRADLYEYGAGMARISDGKPVTITDDYLGDYLGRAIRFEKWLESKREFKATATPSITVKTIQARTGERGLQRLTGIIESPTLRTDGSILDEPGFDAATGLVYLNDDIATVKVPIAPSLEAVGAAVAKLWAPFARFPLDGDLSRAVVMAGVLTAAIRAALPRAPGFGFDAPDKGSGKTLLARAIGAVMGSEPVVSTPPASDEEQRKALFASLRGGARVILWDNLVAALDGAAINAFLSAADFNDRVLGHSRTESYPNRALFFVTGNNLRIEGDTCRRVLVARIDAQTESPFLREFPFDPVQMITRRRLEFVVAALTIIRGYIAHGGGPVVAGSTASFEEWDRLVRQPVAWLAKIGLGPGLADPCDALRQKVADDPKHALLGNLLRGWYAHFGKAPQFLKDVWNPGDLSIENSPLEQALLDIEAEGPKGAFNTKRLAKWLASVRGQVVDGLRFYSYEDAKTKQLKWSVQTI